MSERLVEALRKISELESARGAAQAAYEALRFKSRQDNAELTAQIEILKAEVSALRAQNPAPDDLKTLARAMAYYLASTL